MARKKKPPRSKLELQPDIERQFVKALALCNGKKAAAAFVGISEATVYNWIARGREGEEPFASFATAVRKAEAVFEITYLMRIAEASKSDWRAGAWTLEKLMPKKYGSRAELDVTMRTRPDLSEATEAELEMMRDVLLRGGGGNDE